MLLSGIDVFQSKFHNSNYYIFQLANGNFVIVDPGDPDINKIKKLIQEKNGNISAVLLTHEHADHCAGINNLYDFQHFELFCSQECAQNIAKSKQNFSFYIDIIPAFEVHLPSVKVADGEVRSIAGVNFKFVETPGHSPGSMCIFTNNSVFTGDTLLNNTKTPLTFPHSNRKQYAESIEKLKTLIQPGMMIYPGHGEPFIFESWNQFVWYKK
jgi:hydroxyacylglutathione hydrolase